MSAGKWLYLTTPRDLAEKVFAKFGFRVLRESSDADDRRVTMLRTPAHAGGSPFEKLGGDVGVRDATRADWPLIVALLQHYRGADPRVALAESALAAEATALDLFTQQQQGSCHLMIAYRQRRIIGLGSVATDQGAERTYAMTLPHDQPVDGLRQALIDFARARGCRQVDFPMEALAPSATGDESSTDAAEITPRSPYTKRPD
jgi:hypothetical protein